MKTALAIGILFAAASAGFAASGTVRHVAIEGATELELESTVIPRGVMVFRESDMRDVRLGDGLTPGGVGLWNYSALTNPPGVYDRDLLMAGYSLLWNATTFNSLSSGAEGPLWYLRNQGSNVLTIVSGRDSTRNGIVNIEEVGTDQVKISLLNAEGSAAPLIEVCTNLTNQVWTAVAYATNRVSTDLLECLIDVPDVGFYTFRVTQEEIPLAARFRVPVDAPSFTVNGEPFSMEELDPMFSASVAAGINANTVSNWNAAYGWGNHSQAGYLTEETDPDFSISAAAGITTNLIANWDAAYGFSLTNYVPVSALAGPFPIVGPVTIGATDGEYVIVSGNAIVSMPSGICMRFGQAIGWHVSSEADGETNKIIDASAMTLNAFPGAEGVWKVTTDANTDSDMVNWRSMLRWGAPRTNPVLSGVVMFSSNTTNFYIRPDGKTNSVSFDSSGNMVINASGTDSIVVLTNGNVGIKHEGSTTYPLMVGGDIVAVGGRMRALDFRDSASSTYFLDPNGESALASVRMDGNLTATQGVSKIILPTATNGLVAGTIWNDAGTVKVMP